MDLMVKVKHLDVTVNDDMLKAENFDGNLREFAARKLNEAIEKLAGQQPPIEVQSIAGIQEYAWQSEIHPLECDSGTWYKRNAVRLSVWLQI